jgi:translation initiation factor IF-1
MLSDIERIHILNRFLESMKVISNKEYQQQIWLHEGDLKFDDFTEMVRHIFDDSNSILENYKDFWVTHDQRQILLKFREKFECISSIRNNPDSFLKKFIHAPEWSEIIEIAKELLLAFEYKNGLTGADRRSILNEYLRTIHHISDKEYQRRIWIRGEGPECDDFDETCCYFFDDSTSIFHNYEDFWITNSQYQILKRFRDKFEAFADDNNWPPEFIDTPEWTEITEMAKEVLQTFDYQI